MGTTEGTGAASNFQVAASPLALGVACAGFRAASVLVSVGIVPHVPVEPSWLLVALQCPSHCRMIMCPGDISLCFLVDNVDNMDKEEAREEYGM